MAPHRLIRRRSLLDLAEGRSGLRWWIIRRTPTVLIDYLFEILTAAAGVITGLGILTDFVSQNSIVFLLPDWLAKTYAATLLLGAVTAIVGLATNKYGTVLANGMKLLAIGCLVYAIAGLYFAGLERALAPVVMSSVLAALSGWRAFILHSTYLLYARGLVDVEPKKG